MLQYLGKVIIEFFSGRTKGNDTAFSILQSVISCFSVKYDSRAALPLYKTGLIFGFLCEVTIISFLRMGRNPNFFFSMLSEVLE